MKKMGRTTNKVHLSNCHTKMGEARYDANSIDPQLYDGGRATVPIPNNLEQLRIIFPE